MKEEDKLYVVFCRDNCDYVLATRTIFPSKNDAIKYCHSIHEERAPVVVLWEPEKFCTMRHDWSERFGVGEQRSVAQQLADDQFLKQDDDKFSPLGIFR